MKLSYYYFMVIYFTGTGNSRFAAEAFAYYLKDQVISANELIKKKEAGQFTSENPWIFVFPVYLSNIVITFADFLRKSSFTGNKNAYFIGTCASLTGSSPNEAIKICKEKELNYCGCEALVMPQSYIALFKMTDKEECNRRYEKAVSDIKAFSQIISENKPLNMKTVSKGEYAVTRLVEKLYYKSFTGTKKFFATDKCIGCSLCERLCPLNNIEMKNGKPEWKGKCIHCMACINHCPKAAIEYGKKTAEKNRYVCKSFKN